MNGYTLKKSLGQHFLKDEEMCKKIVRALHVTPGMQLLEIGPGAGALTKYLLQIPAIHFKCVEVDAEKVSYLHNAYPALRGKIIREDFLTSGIPFDGEFTIIGNFPYNISSQILFRILEWKSQVKEVVGMFQKEVAERITAPGKNKDYGILSVLVQAFYGTEYLFEVPRHSFQPPPRVTSAVIRLRYEGNPYGVENEKQFFTLVKTSFGQRRKMLRNPLKGLFDKGVLQEVFFNKRAEELTVKEFVDLSKRML